MSGLVSVGYFLFSLLFSLLTFVLWTRIALRYFRISALHPVCLAINRLTNPVLAPLSVLFTSKTKRLSRYDWSCFIALVIVEIAKFITFGWLLLGIFMPIALVVLYVAADLIVQPCDLLFYAILIRVIMSWVNPGWQHPFADVLRHVTKPILQTARRLIPDIAGFDFSPFLALIVLKVITLFISSSRVAS